MYISNAIDSVTVGKTEATSEEIIFTDREVGRFQVPTGSDITTITWYDAPKPGGTYVAAYDSAGNAVTQTVSAAKSYQIPTALEGAGAIKAVGNNEGTIAVYMKG
jgi:hypothetical protein